MRFIGYSNKKFIACFNLLIVTAIIFFPSLSQEAGNPLLSYLEQKALSNYINALEILEEWTFKENDPVIIETNLFRINELAKFPDLTEKAIAGYNKILKNKTFANNPDLEARAAIFLNLLYLRQGRTQEATSAINNLGLIRQYKMAGPIKNTDIFNNLSVIPEENEKDRTWFDVSADLSGKIDAEDFFNDIRNPVIFLRSEVSSAFNGRYVFHLGKTGHTDIWIDGKKIFSNKKKHGFSYDQYRVEVHLTKGKHDLLIKTGDSPRGTQLALRLTDINGNAINEGSGSNSGSSEPRASFFRALENALQSNPSGERQFNAGYLYYASGLNSEEDREAAVFFSKVKDGAYAAFANYYSGLLEKEDYKKNFYFNESFNAFKRNIESISEIVNIKIKNNFLYEAFPLIDKIKEINNHSFIIHNLQAKAFLKLGWDFEALKEASKQKESEIKSSGYEIEAGFHYDKRQYRESLSAFKFLYEADRYNLKNLESLLECCVKTVRFDEAEKLLSQSAQLFPNNVMLRLKHAGLIGNIKGPGAALPYLLSARKISPHNNDVLLMTGLAYRKLNNDELALQFMRAALKRNRNDERKSRIKRYIGIISEGLKRNAGSKFKKKDLVEPKEKSDKSKSYLPGHSDKSDNFIFLEREVINSYYSGSDDIFNKIENLLRRFPAEAESLFYYRELAELSGIYGCERTAKTLRALLASINNIDFPQKNLFLLSVKLELERLLYLCDIEEAKKLSHELSPVKKWMLSGPYSKYGPKDLDYPFLPELTANYNNSNIKKKEINIDSPDGELDFAKYLYPEKGIAYAINTISIDKPVKIRIYSNNSYKLFINGKEAIKNQKGDIFRTCRIVKVWNADRITLMIKSFFKNRNDLRILITDENDNVLNVNIDCSRFVFSDFNFIEEPDYPFNLFSDAALSGRSDIADPNYKLARYFHGLESDEAIKFYRKAIAGAKTDTPRINIKLASCLPEQSGSDSGIYNNSEGRSIIKKLAEKYPDFMPAREMKLKGLVKTGMLNEAYQEAAKALNNNNAASFSFRMAFADILLKAGYEKEFEKEIESLIRNYPDSIQPLKLLADYYKYRNVIKAIEIHNKILTKLYSEESVSELIGIYKEQGRYDHIKTLLIQHDYRARFRKELIESLIAAGNFPEAKRTIFQELAKKNDPEFNKMLGDISYYEGLDPVMYWQKALSIRPSYYNLNALIAYFESGGVENPFKQYEDKNIEKYIQNRNRLKEIQNNCPAGLLNLKKSMVFLLNEDGGSRLFCEDLILLRGSKSAGGNNNSELYKHMEYKIPFEGEVFPLNFKNYDGEEKLSDLFTLKKKNGKYHVSLPLVTEDSFVYISYYINNPVVNPKGTGFFTLPETSINYNDSLSVFDLKLIAPKDIKVMFSLNKKFEVKSESISDRIVYNVFINNKKPEYKEKNNSLKNEDYLKFGFSTMADMRDLVLWYAGQIHEKFKLYDDSVKLMFAGKGSAEAIKSVYEYVSSEIKLKSNNLFSARKSMDTYYLKSGSAEDKAILAASILSELGIRSYVAFTFKRDYFDNEPVVFPDAITNILLFVPLDVKEGVWMDFSDANNKFGQVNKRFAGKDAAVLIKDNYEIKKISGKD